MQKDIVFFKKQNIFIVEWFYFKRMNISQCLYLNKIQSYHIAFLCEFYDIMQQMLAFQIIRIDIIL